MRSDLVKYRHEAAPARWNARGLDDPYRGGIAVAKPTCMFPGCEAPPVNKRGWCNKHYLRWRRHGDPAVTLLLRDPAMLSTRFWLNVNKAGPLPEHRPELGPCWLWTGGLASTGYGGFSLNGKKVGAHRVAYQLAVGPIPAGLTLDHLCRRPICVRPSHLDPATQRENILRGEGPTAKLAQQTHCKRGHALTPDNVYYRPGKRMRDCRQCRREGHRARRAKGKC